MEGVTAWDEAQLGWGDEAEQQAAAGGRRLTATPFSSVRRRAVEWLWKEKVPVGALVLLVGREGIGKSTVAYDLAASITRGKLPGDQHGKPRGVVVVATEDSLESTIAPRLDAAGADDTRVFHVTAATPDGMTEDLLLPVDIQSLSEIVQREDIALIILDPLTSRLRAGLDTHKDADVRKALEPLTRFAEQSGAAVIGVMHVNKGNSPDPANQIMGSRAFPAVARGVLFIQSDVDNEERNCMILEVVKSNLGPCGRDNLLFDVQEVQTGFDQEKGLPIISSKIHWIGKTDRNVRDAMAAAGDLSNDHEEINGSGLWLRDYMAKEGGEVDAAEAIREGLKAGYNAKALQRARKKLGYPIAYRGFPRRSFWRIPVGEEGAEGA